MPRAGHEARACGWLRAAKLRKMAANKRDRADRMNRARTLRLVRWAPIAHTRDTASSELLWMIGMPGAWKASICLPHRDLRTFDHIVPRR